MNEKLLKAVRGKDYRAAFQAIARLRHESDVDVPAVKAKDEQREFQLRVARIVAGSGVAGLAAEWPRLGHPKWRAILISEIGQFASLWAEEALVDLGVAALEDESADVQAKAVWAVLEWLRGGSKSGLDRWITREHRARMTRAYSTMLERNRGEYRPVLQQIVESLGHTAVTSDSKAVALLEALRPMAGETHTVSHEKLDESNLDWRSKLVAERKGIDPASLKLRIAYTPTGLIDAKVLEASLKQIRARNSS